MQTTSTIEALRQDETSIKTLEATPMPEAANIALGDAFDNSNEPIIYMSDNRMPVMVEFNLTIIYIVFAALVLALLFIIPGVRRTKLTSLIGLLTLLMVGASILLALQGSQWLTGSVQLSNVPYGSLTSDLVSGKLGVNIGLLSVNVTLMGKLSSNKADNLIAESDNGKYVDYNERFYWDSPDKMAREHIEALRKGLPYPILTVTEFLSQDVEGFNWTRQLRQAGYYCSLTLYASIVSWCLMTIVMCVLPVYLPHLMQITGALMMSSVWIYTLVIQSPNRFAIQIGGQPIEFAFGYTAVTTFATGAISMFAGVLLFAIQMNHPHEQFTIMDSEQYVQDQKVLYNSNLSSNIAHLVDRKPDISSGDSETKKKKPVSKTLNRSNSVIIPMADIEENFKQTQLPPFPRPIR